MIRASRAVGERRCREALSPAVENRRPSLSECRYRRPIKEANLMEIASEAVGEEPVLAAGVFQPLGTEEGLAGGVGAAGASRLIPGGGAIRFAASTAAALSGRIAAKAEKVPRWTLVAVTRDRTHLFSVRSLVPWVTVSHPKPFATVDRAKLEVERNQLGPVTHLTLKDTESARSYALEWQHAGDLGHGNAVVEALAKSQ